ncbi:MAG: 16S rRNA (guanine(966)-N(2))-methyltransferase RsmD, partial [Nannocystaceae bacterium]|nr:16S rRNA (guanine(966)-N(2))-methyltransferase RsmD [Nannocystaceae bacterium]
MQRIGGGSMRGRVLLALPEGVAGLRPMGARVRGALFDCLQAEVLGARVLDLFAGSGALGFEALSRGADHCTMLDLDTRVVAHLRTQADALSVGDRCTVVRTDALRYLASPPPKERRFDLVFVDPPFAIPEVFDPVMQLLAEGGWLAPNARVACESERVRGKTRSIAWPSDLDPYFSRAYGQAHLEIARERSEPSRPLPTVAEVPAVSTVPISQRAERITPSATLAVSGRANILRAEGKEVLNFAAGEPDFLPPKAVRTAVAERAATERVSYAPVPGIPELRDAVAAELGAVHGRTFERSEILVSCGAKHSLANLFLATCDPGDEVVIVAPYWVSYPDMIGLAEAKTVVVHTTAAAGWRMTPEALQAALSPKTKLIVLNNPGNPTGAGYGHSELRALAEVIAKHAPAAWVVVDDIYRKLVYDGFVHASAVMAFDGLSDRVIIVDGVSKTYAMTGFRIGFLAGPKTLISAASRIQSQMTSGAATPSQYAALVALTDPSVAADTDAMREAFARRRTLALAGLAEVAGVSVQPPDGAFYVFADVSRHVGPGTAHDTDVALATWLLEEKLVATVPGTPFGAPGHLRISYAT